MIVMSVASVLLSIMIALIPFIASRIVRGDIGSTLMTVVSGAVTAGAVASGLAFAGGEGLAAGRMVASEGPPPRQPEGLAVQPEYRFWQSGLRCWASTEHRQWRLRDWAV